MIDWASMALPIIGVGYLFFSVYRIILYRKLDKKRKRYEVDIQDRMLGLQEDLGQRSKDLYESIQMINQEYHHMMKGLSSSQKQAGDELHQKLQEFESRMKEMKDVPSQARPMGDLGTDKADDSR